MRTRILPNPTAAPIASPPAPRPPRGGGAPRLAAPLGFLALALLATCLLVVGVAPARGQDTEPSTATPAESTPANGAQAQPDGEAEEARPETPEEKFARISSPGEHHAHLGRQAGEWEAEIRIWAAPETEPIVTPGVIESHWILGGRFLETTFRGELFGEPFEGKGVDGYDNYAKKYVGTWRDNLGTLTLLFKGECTDDGTVRTMMADLTDPISGKALRNKAVTTFSLEEDTYTYASFLVAPDGTEFQNFEMKARRK